MSIRSKLPRNELDLLWYYVNSYKGFENELFNRAQFVAMTS